MISSNKPLTITTSNTMWGGNMVPTHKMNQTFSNKWTTHLNPLHTNTNNKNMNIN